MRRWLSAAIFTGLVLQPLHAAAPSVVMLYGAGRAHPIYLTDRDENQSVMMTLQDQRAFDTSGLADRAYVRIAFFWGSRWQAHVAEKRPLSEIRPDETGHHGRFYPATRSQPAVILQTEPGPWPAAAPPDDVSRFTRGGPASPDALAILRKAGVAVQTGR